MEKPRIKYGTVAWMIEKYITEAQQPGGRPLGLSHYYTLRTMQSSRFGAIAHAELKPGDFLDHCKGRKAKGIKPQTINHDMTYTSGVLKHAVQVWEMDDHGLEMYRKAKPQLMRQQLIGKSESRDRLPTADELERLRALFVEQNKRPKNKIDMVKVADWQYKSCRRISESCRMEWADWERDTQTLVVHKMKDPRNRNKTKRVALTDEAQALLVSWWEKRDPNEPRILPYISASCSARYTAAKHACGIEGLRMHDSRRDRFTRLVEDDGYSLEEAIMFTGHETVAVPQRNYLAMRPELMRFGPKTKRAEVAVSQMNAAGHLFVTPEGVGTSKAA